MTFIFFRVSNTKIHPKKATLKGEEKKKLMWCTAQPIYPFTMKAQVLHYFKDKIPLHSILGLLNVKLYSQSLKIW